MKKINLFHKKKCQCIVVEEMINNPDEHGKYLENIKKLDDWENKGLIELYAGDSYLNDIKIHCNREDRYTINHYYRCKKCGKVFFIGFCCRGGYIFKVADCDLESIDFDHIMGENEKLGVRFNNEKRFR